MINQTKKKNYKKFYDIGILREAPVIFFNNFLYIGNKLDTHTLLLNKILGLDLNPKTEEEALKINRGNEITKVSEFENEILFGNLFEKTIYWEHFSDKKLLNKVKMNNKDYKHKILNYKR